MNKKDYIKLGDLDVYVLAIELSDIAWAIYKKMDWQIKYPISNIVLTVGRDIISNIQLYVHFH